MRRILLTGGQGQVGWELRRTLMTLGEVVAPDRKTLDLADPDSIRRAVQDIRPTLIVNAAAYTAVDRAEEERDLAMRVNGITPGILAEEAGRSGAAIVHYSTDYVFDGTRDAPYTESDGPNPLNVYGRTKLAGERAIQQAGVPHLILRTSWVYGGRGRNFLLTIRKLAQEREELRVVSDQIGAPTWSRLIAETTTQMLTVAGETWVHPQRGGVYHLAAGGETSWYGFAKIILESVNSKTRLTAISSSEYPTAAARPLNSRLSTGRLARDFGLEMPGWETGFSLCMEELGAVRTSD